ncbi:hypothetical protein [Hoeflea marina]|uniref:hypothetical protein n=1 Tax=Hoeflea marina TaxID=274592 RepID=UPI000D709008|nr:hypothetical protein [Hoeflea marina]
MTKVIYLNADFQLPEEYRYIVERDEFAITIRVEDHNLFFVRLEAESRTPLVTDFHPGGIGDAALNTALSMGLREARIGELGSLVFRDVISNGSRPANRAALLAARARAQRAANHVALERGQLVDRLAFSECNGKVDIIVSFSGRC